jgi:hypothetical protein
LDLLVPDMKERKTGKRGYTREREFELYAA